MGGSKQFLHLTHMQNSSGLYKIPWKFGIHSSQPKCESIFWVTTTLICGQGESGASSGSRAKGTSKIQGYQNPVNVLKGGI